MFGQSSRNNPPPSTASGRKRLTGRDWKIPSTGRLQLLSNKTRKGSLSDANQRGVVRRPRTGLTANSNSGGLTSAATPSTRLFSLSNTSGSGSSQRFLGARANAPAPALAKSSRSKETASLSKPHLVQHSSLTVQDSSPPAALPSAGVIVIITTTRVNWQEDQAHGNHLQTNHQPHHLACHPLSLDLPLPMCAQT